ncbi:MAG: DUF433 domain-containing protein [Candidatus Baldrarchaeia archaeon]
MDSYKIPWKKSAEKDLEKIIRDPNILKGKLVIKGTRISVEFILKLLENGWSIDEICEEYELTREDVIAAIRYARKAVETRE